MVISTSKRISKIPQAYSFFCFKHRNSPSQFNGMGLIPIRCNNQLNEF
uniref:Uncharacterized protein n=1 Tax=Myoviridae sp. ctIty1 TaxID=2827673 RepID=A0A8S5THY6_9CAUD|nr:MAG TPA: hypothetical protein [Myoviridae sp. ctIty1]